jgi:hypothetical protein
LTSFLRKATFSADEEKGEKERHDREGIFRN